MRFFQVAGLLFIILWIAACQPTPPTVVYIVISPTPQEADTELSVAAAQAEAPTTLTLQQTPNATSPPPTSPPPTATPDIFPTDTVAQIQVAEQVFENGRMMWVQPVSQIWVMTSDGEGRGQWLRYQDTFNEGTDPETNPDLTPPEGRIQPERGFGKLWRENPEIRESLGWAITPEFGYISQYGYYPGGYVDDNNEYVPGFGTHELFSLDGEQFRFNEETETWTLGG